MDPYYRLYVEEGSPLSRTRREIVVDRWKIGECVVEHFLSYLRERGEPPYCMLIGSDEYHSFIRDEIYNPFGCEASFRVVRESRYGRVEYKGVKVICVPWMRGMICLHDIRGDLS